VPQKQESQIGRREFLSLMAASTAMAGMAGCAAAPPENIVPYVRPPEELLPGRPLAFATATQTAGDGIGLVVESHLGRPVKIEGNPDHPATLGATDAFAQASILTLYDPDRAQTVTNAGQISTWDAFITDLAQRLPAMGANGSGLRFLTETIVSPTLADLLNQILSRYPGSRWHQYEPVNHDLARLGAQLAFGQQVDTHYNFELADVILSLDSDFLMWAPGKLRYAREFAKRRRVPPGVTTMNRLYALESTPTITGAMADHRIPMRSSSIGDVARALAARIGVPVAETGASQEFWIGPLLDDLERARGRSIVIAGETQPPEVHALAHVMNERLGNAGSTVVYTEPVESNPVLQLQSLTELARDMEAGIVQTLVIMSGNPVYNAPADLEFARRIGNVPLRIHHSIYYDETSAMCHWHIPESHYLEMWGDVRAYDGTISLIQPLILPLYQSRSAYELASALLGDPTRSNYQIVLNRWQKEYQVDDFEGFWTRTLRLGLIPGTETRPVTVRARSDFQMPERGPQPEETLELVFRPDPSVFDGRWANNAWLQETPKPIHKLVWDNAALISSGTASRLDLRNGDVVEIGSEGRTLGAAVWIVPGQADGSITLYLGYGRHMAGRVGNNRGFNAYALRTTSSQWIAPAVSVRKTDATYPLVTTQEHHALDGRDIVRGATTEHYAEHPHFVHAGVHTPEPEETLYPEWKNVGYAWGMAVDLSACIGCNACVVACQAENNIPVVGKSEVANSREMHWLRIDTYHDVNAGAPATFFQPMLCQHCETAPCEVVCPVEATSHSAEGLNEMTYNRCVGTRYCSNNCPYKVRRFNFYQYADWDIPQLKLLYNPDVTVRSRGVIEKCTYCVQRINRARINAKKEDRQIRDGEVVTACQAACPTQAIVFGDILDPGTAVSRLKAEPRNYGVLAELNTRPRTTYLAKLANPNPNINHAG
jgi:molybdopterin-containing oxidoreductase family iron-sulfur binding subunit